MPLLRCFCDKIGHLKAVSYSRKKTEIPRKEKEPQACTVLAVSQNDAAQRTNGLWRTLLPLLGTAVIK